MSKTRELIEKAEGELAFVKPGDPGYQPGNDGQFSGDWAEFASPEKSQVENGVYVRERGLPWHVKLSRLLGSPELMQGNDGLMDLERVFELVPELASDVSLKPIYVGRKGAIIEGKLATVRELDGKPLGIVTPRYQVFQNRAAFGFLDTLVDDGQAKYETAGTLRGGAVSFISMELDELDINVPGDDSSVRTYLSAINSFDGSFPYEAMVSHVRTTCINTARLARKGSLSHFRLKHTGSFEGKVAVARDALGITFKAAKEFEAIANRLADKAVSDDDVLAVYRKAWNFSEELSEGRQERHHSTLAYENYLNSETIPDTMRGNGWGAFNAATEYLDHIVDWKGKTRDTDSVRALELLDGTGQDKKELILKELLTV